MTNQQGSERVTRKLDPRDADILSDQDDSSSVDQPAPWVIELRVVGTPAIFQMKVQGELVIGRSDPRYDSKPDIDLEPYDGYQLGVSRRHATISPRNNRLILTDQGSSNGTFVNGRTLLQGQEYRIKHGDMIVIGKLQLQIFFAVMPTSKDLAAERTQPIDLQIPTLGSGQHFLVVDNDADVANVIGSVLQNAGFTVTVVGSFADAAGMIDKQMPDAVILELLLPDISGLDLVRYIRERSKDMPMLVVTSVTGGFQMGQAIDAGVDVYLCKPVGIDELVRGIDKVTAQMQR